MFQLEKRASAVVTGGAGGIGLAIAKALASQGVNISCWDTANADFDRVEKLCDDAGVSFKAEIVDVRNRDQCFVAAERTRDLGPLKYGVNCAGVDHLQATAETSHADWQRVLDINLTGVLNSCLAQRAVMAGGAIVNIGSLSGSIINRDATPHAGYSASKAGVAHLSRALAVEWAAEDIRVNTISPGYTNTPMTAHNPPELNRKFRNQSPMGRMAEVEEIAGPALFLLSSAATYITGVDLPVDGGVLIW